ncbi:DUF3306 domain-containing protein [Ottowia sp. VDI28]|uniref:DUF3306 domain-containing protein n=1 Tax=Ottowia sp. VDI28 TaxID=3133968 RepID=UPI003C2E8634
MAEDSHFLSRWSQRKAKARQGAAPASEELPRDPARAEAALPETQALSAPATEPVAPVEQPPLPTLADVEALTHKSDFARFVAPEVSGDVRNAALKKLFSDPHFNVMDGLDTYIDDYNKPDPLPAAMLKKMAHAAYLGLVEPEAEKAPEAPGSRQEQAREQASQSSDESTAGNVSAAMKAHDEDPDLRLQSHHSPGPPGPEPSSGQDAGGQR